MSMLERKLEQFSQPHCPKFTADFTPKKFTAFLLDTILTEIMYCELHQDPLQSSKQLLTAVGKLQDQWYLVQISSRDRGVEDFRIVALPATFLSKLGEFL